jgi:uncharacterized protein YgiM (DUF1202 family)
MKNRYLKFSTLIMLVCFGLTTILPAAALADRDSKPGHRGGHGPEGKHGPGSKHGPAFRHVPPGGQKVRHRGDDYFFHSGRFYRHRPDGYFWVRPPLGIIAYSLPVAAVTVLIGGLTYYLYDNVYYRRVPAGYQVVQVPTQTTTIVHTPPAVPVNPADSGTQVVVMAKILNVRSGPGINHAVLTQTYMGNVLIIQGSASDWYYVRLPDNTYGWVMKAFVTMPDNGAQG